MLKSYRQLFKQSWDIIWRHKFLWFLGFFASLLGNSGGYETIMNSFKGITFQNNFWLSVRNFTDLISSPQYFIHFKEKLFAQPFTFVFLLIFYLVIAAIVLFIFWIIISSSIGIIYSAAKIYNNKKTSLRESWSNGRKFFWPVLGIYLIAILIVGLLSLFISWLIYSISVAPVFSVINYLVMVAIFIIFVLSLFLVSMVVIYSASFVVLKNKKFLDAIKQGINLFIKNWLASLEMIFFIILITIFASLGLLVSFLIISVPLYLLIFILNLLNLGFGIKFVLILSWAIVLIGTFIFNAVLTSFQYTAWVLLFINLVDEKFSSRIKRFGEKV